MGWKHSIFGAPHAGNYTWTSVLTILFFAFFWRVRQSGTVLNLSYSLTVPLWFSPSYYNQYNQRSSYSLYSGELRWARHFNSLCTVTHMRSVFISSTRESEWISQWQRATFWSVVSSEFLFFYARDWRAIALIKQTWPSLQPSPPSAPSEAGRDVICCFFFRPIVGHKSDFEYLIINM